MSENYAWAGRPLVEDEAAARPTRPDGASLARRALGLSIVGLVVVVELSWLALGLFFARRLL